MHLAPRPPDDLEDADLQVIGREVDAFRRRHTFRWRERDDLIQECVAHWLKREPSHDASRAGRTTFLKHVVRNCLKDLRKAEEALVRSGHAEALSLDRPAGRDQSDGVFGDFVRSTAPRPDFLAPLAVSLAKIQERLSERQLQLLRGRLAGYEMTELAHQLGVHRDTLYEDLKRIQRAFFDEGLAPVGFDPTDRRSRS